MSVTVKKIALSEQQTQLTGELINKNYLNVVGAIEVECTIRIGTLNLTITQLRDLKAGNNLPLQQKTNAPIELVLNNQVLAKGELMSHEDHFAIQITEVCC